jgi:hypothetical protein
MERSAVLLLGGAANHLGWSVTAGGVNPTWRPG